MLPFDSVPCLDWEKITGLVICILPFDDSCGVIDQEKNIHKATGAHGYRKLTCNLVKNELFHGRNCSRTFDLAIPDVILSENLGYNPQIHFFGKQAIKNKFIHDFYKNKLKVMINC